MAKVSQSLQQKLQQRLSPQQIQVVRLLEIPLAQLEQRIKKELEENPTLEEGELQENLEGGQETTAQEADNLQEYENEYSIDDYGREEYTEQIEPSRDDEFSVDDYLSDDDFDTSYREPGYGASSSDDDYEAPLANAVTFRDQLLEQLGYLRIDEQERRLAEYIIDNLDADGYLRRNLSALRDDLLLLQGVDVSLPALEGALQRVQELDPPGIGAQSLQECLLLQLREQHSEVAANARRILEQCYQRFVQKHYARIQEELHLEPEALKAAIDYISKLNPKPGDMADAGHLNEAQTIIPDFILGMDERTGELVLALHGENMPELHISPEYRRMLRDYAARKKNSTESDREAAHFVKQKIDAAQWFIDALNQRNRTLMAVMQTIVDFQHDFLVDGDIRKLRPLILKDIANATGLDISTVSRVVSSKYVQTPFGILPLKEFFSEGIQNQDGDTVSTRKIKAAMLSVIEAEDKQSPMTDDQIVEALNAQGFSLARRTVAKYREQLNIPMARLRREM